MVPTDTPVSTDVAHLEAAGVLEWWQLVGHFPWGGFIAGSGGVHVECLVRTLMIELFTDNWDSRARVLVANGTPLSVRMRCGRPNSLKTCVKTCLASCTRVEERASHPSRKRLLLSVMVSG